MYGLAIIPLIKLLSVDDVTQKWYADDGNAVGKLSILLTVHYAKGGYTHI